MEKIRFWEIDFARGIAIIMMIIYHLVFDLNYFGFISVNMYNGFLGIFQKIIAVLQNLDGKLIWNLNCITTDMGVIKVHVDDQSHSVLKFEKINLFDVVKKL